MKHRKLRIAWSASWGVAAVLLSGLWVRSYTWGECYVWNVGHTSLTASDLRGVFVLLISSADGKPGYSWGPASEQKLTEGFPQHFYGFYFVKMPWGYGAFVPMWFLIILSMSCGVLPWFTWHFTTRTLLVATTFAAILCAVAAYLSAQRISSHVPRVGAAAKQQAGIGVALRVENGKVFVSNVLPKTPASESGQIKINDQIAAVAEGQGKPMELIDSKDVAKVVGMIRGPVGSSIRLSIIPAGKGESDQIVVSLVRGNIKQIDTFVDGRLLPVGFKAPNFKFTPLANSENTELDQLRGRIVVVEFWASWCGPCVNSLSDFDSLEKSRPEWGKAVSIVAVNVDDAKEKAEEIISKNKWPNLSVVWAGPAVLAQYRVAGLPTVYVIDKSGKVLAVDHRLDIPALITPLLERLDDSQTPGIE